MDKSPGNHRYNKKMITYMSWTAVVSHMNIDDIVSD
jgi:hypothetical protein